MAKVGSIGAGLMSTACTGRLMKAGVEVAAYDVNEAKRTKIGALGARAATALADVVGQCVVNL